MAGKNASRRFPRSLLGDCRPLEFARQRLANRLLQLRRSLLGNWRPPRSRYGRILAFVLRPGDLGGIGVTTILLLIERACFQSGPLANLPFGVIAISVGKTHALDSNGDTLTGAGRSFAWTPDNRVDSVTMGGTTTMDYDPSTRTTASGCRPWLGVVLSEANRVEGRLHWTEGKKVRLRQWAAGPVLGGILNRALHWHKLAHGGCFHQATRA
jgi:hypothetical protein